MNDLRSAFREQAIACRALGSPFMNRLLSLLAETWPDTSALASACANIQGDPGPAGASLPLRIAGGLHALRLGGDADLAAIYPPGAPDDATFRAGILDALNNHDAFLAKWIQSPPQTNEIRRSAALIPAARVAAARFGLPIRLSELGASGGLNLLWDSFALEGPDWRVGPEHAVLTLSPEWDGPPPPDAAPAVLERRGVDLLPLDSRDPTDMLRLTAFLWPDQPDRLAMTRAAANAEPATVDRGDAIDWLETRLADAREGELHMIQNTIAWQYFDDAARDRGRRLIAAAGTRASETRPLAWMQLENDGDGKGRNGAAITLQMWPRGEVRSLGRADFHGRWVQWRPQGTTAGRT